MKIGTAITFLFLSLIALGYLLSDDMNTREELVQIGEQNQQMSQELQAVQVERDAANESLAESEQKIIELTQQNLAYQEQIQYLSEENTILKKQNSALQSQAGALKFFNSIQSSFPRSLGLALFLPIIPISMAATYVIVRNNKNHDQRTLERKAQRNTSVQLTDDEIKEIIRIRRA